VRVHLAGEHPPELEPRDLGRDAVDLADQIGEQRGVPLPARELAQLLGLDERLVDPA
jgi:hypothetical protein